MTTKKRTGAKGKYQEWITEDGLTRIEGWARDGLTDEQISKNIGIRRETLYAWIKKYPNISNALKKGKAPIDTEVENALVKRALGFEYEETKTVIEVMPDGEKKQKVEKTKKYIPPDVGAITFWLKNRKPDVWRRMSPEYQAKLLAETDKLQLEMDVLQAELKVMKDLEASDNDKVIIVNNLDDERMKKWVEENGGL